MNNRLKVGDKIIIISDKIGNKPLANVEKGEIVTITGFSDDGKIMYHHNSLALPVNSEIYMKVEPIEKVCMNCKHLAWLVALGQGLKCMHPDKEPKFQSIKHSKHTCELFEYKISEETEN